MKTIKPFWVFLTIACLSAIATLAIEHSVWGLPGDKLDSKILALQHQLQRSQAQRDSLNTLLAAHQDTLHNLMAAEADLAGNLELLRVQLASQDALIERLRTTSPNHDLTTDSLLNDLNAIVRALYASEGPAVPAE